MWLGTPVALKTDIAAPCAGRRPPDAERAAPARMIAESKFTTKDTKDSQWTEDQFIFVSIVRPS